MEKTPVTGALIEQQGAQLRRLEIAPERAAEIAQDIARMNDAVIDTADEVLDFNDEPARFAARQLAHRAVPGKRK